MTDAQDQIIYDSLQLQDKLIEPDKRLQNINRNLQLGNITSQQLDFMNNKLILAIRLNNIPEKKGGYIMKHFSEEIQSEVDTFIVASNSVGGFGRKSQKRMELEQRQKDETDRSFFGAFRRK